MTQSNDAMTQTKLAFSLRAQGRTMGWIGYIVIYMFTMSRDRKFSNMLRNDLKVERKKGSSPLLV